MDDGDKYFEWPCKHVVCGPTATALTAKQTFTIASVPRQQPYMWGPTAKSEEKRSLTVILTVHISANQTSPPACVSVGQQHLRKSRSFQGQFRTPKNLLLVWLSFAQLVASDILIPTTKLLSR